MPQQKTMSIDEALRITEKMLALDDAAPGLSFDERRAIAALRKATRDLLDLRRQLELLK
jgi:ABC-type branched-subunit amino acid transport system ATPase component